MRTLFVVAALAIAALASTELSFQGGVNLTNANADFSFRYTHAEVDDILVAKFLVWSSASIDSSSVNTSSATTADGMIGIGALPTALTPATTIFAYGKGSAAVRVDVDSAAKNLFVSKQKLDASFDGGIMAMAALTMQEFDANNKPVGDLLYMHPQVSCGGEKISGDNGNITGLTCSFKATKASLLGFIPTDVDVTITYVTSMKAGILEYGKTPVSPRSYEMVIEVKNYPLSKDENHVRMHLGFLSVSIGAEMSGSAKEVIHKEGQDDVYVAASEYVIVGNNVAKVNVNVTSGNPGISDFMEAALEVALGAQFDARIATVDFPAGAKDFIYDPAVGAGKSVYEAGASTVALSFLVALVCALLYLF